MDQDLKTPSVHELNLLSEVVGYVSRARRLTPEQGDDFAQTVQVRLLERDYDIFRRFSGRSSLRTYLVVVVTRLLLDWRNECYGKWRPSAAAVRLGADAVRLDRLINRDGYTPDEAIESLRTSSPAAPPSPSLRRVVDALPRRPWRRFVALEQLRAVPGAPFVDPVDQAEEQRHQSRLQQEIASTLQRLPIEDRRLLAARFVQGRSIQSLAKALSIDPKKLYRRCEALLRTLRSQLLARGVLKLENP